MSKKKNSKSFDNPDFMHSREARAIRILSEYIDPEKRFKDKKIMHTVVFFGSARLKPDTEDLHKTARFYKAAEDFAYNLALLANEIKNDIGEYFYICSGGGPGIMEAANKGAALAGAKSIGLNIELPFEQSENKYVTPELSFEFHYFFMRKLWFLYQAKALIVFPGGFGTLDELFEVLTLVQTRKLGKINIPILLYDKNFWEDFIDFNKMVDFGLISPEDLDLFHYFSSTEEGIEFLRPRLKTIMQNLHHYHAMKFPI